MPVNENESWPNEHTLYMAMSGAGKGSMIRGNPDIPKPYNGGRIVIWDTAKAFPGYYYASRQSFLKGLASALDYYDKTGKGFAIGYTGGIGDKKIEHEWWAGVIRGEYAPNTSDPAALREHERTQVLNGKYRTHLVDEEVYATSLSAHKPGVNSCWVADESRKYGGVWHGTGQRPANTPKTYVDSCETYYLGRQKRRTAEIVADMVDLDSEYDLTVLQNGEFYKEHLGTVEKGRYAKVNIKRKMLSGGVIKVT